jgi:hypothetical protein
MLPHVPRHRPCRALAWALLTALGGASPGWSQVGTLATPSATDPSTEGRAVLPPVDEALVRAAGLRVLKGQHLTLYTDLPPSPDVDELPLVFDRAAPLWSHYFGFTTRATDRLSQKLAAWRVRGSIMANPARFVAAGLLPDDLPKFLHGYSRDNQFWCFEQSDDYFRRHLMLHEGTHLFMARFVGDSSPAWLFEGLAERLGTHTWQNGELVLRHFPAARQEAPQWGRVKIVRDAVAAGRGKSLVDCMSIANAAYRENEPYGWSWAACALLDAHPRYRDRFRALSRTVDRPEFNARLRSELEAEWSELCDEFVLFTREIEYGYDFERAAVLFAPGQAFDGRREARVAADRGWQSTGLQLSAGHNYRLQASGQFQLVKSPRVWRSEAGGVTIRYHRGRPLGLLQAALRPDAMPGQVDSGAAPWLVSPRDVGLETELTPTVDGTLYLRVNDSPAELADNAGELTVMVESIAAKKAP